MKLHPSITQDRVLEAAQSQMFGLENPGFCVACGEDAMGCQPDDCNYKCECCGERKVFGAQELMFMMVA